MNEGRWALPFLLTHGMSFLNEQDPYDQCPVYPRLVRTFYQTFTKLPQAGNKDTTTDLYMVRIGGKEVKFTTKDICLCLGVLPDYSHKTGFGPPREVSTEEMIQDMCGGCRTKNGLGSRRAHLPPDMWLMDSLLRHNLCPIGHGQERHQPYLSILYYIYKDIWFNLREVYLDSIQKIHSKVARTATTEKGKLYFPRLITRLLVHLGVSLPTPTPVQEYEPVMFEESQFKSNIIHMRSTRGPDPVAEETAIPAATPTMPLYQTFRLM
ncbi:uncharacterized protein LOC119981860 [Tripterygium wilfordii]|uniref:uncharacterized protein LOC119981860 n=1 Tax=Tripterygium wilfordii TaxID=458696 RepID=UPI0018F7E792|nr:uncharacterized protein LOC119981860 [Tripterygium wilfordii]